jgi:hypothetical protein
LKKYFDTHIKRKGDFLQVPEGLHTIPCTHGIHRFPGKFIPNIPRYIIRQSISDKSQTILDPFCGSGTSLVELALEGRKFVGLDIDALSFLISKVKTTLVPDSILRNLEKDWADHDYNDFVEDLVPNVPNLQHWFSPLAIEQLTSIKKRCLNYNEPARSFCLVVFSSIIRRVSNADDQTQKTYVSGTLLKNPPLPSKLFPVFLKRAIKGMDEFRIVTEGTVFGAVQKWDARNGFGSFDFEHIITSPPYIDSIDYMYNQMLEYYWLLGELGIGDYEEFRKARKEPMGQCVVDSSEVTRKLSSCLGSQYNHLLDFCDTIQRSSPNEAKIVASFFYDFAQHVDNVQCVQPNGGLYCCVIGNSIVRKNLIPTAEFVTQIFNYYGYQTIDVLEYEIKRHYMKFPRRSNSGVIKKDFVLVFERK